MDQVSFYSMIQGVITGRLGIKVDLCIGLMYKSLKFNLKAFICRMQGSLEYPNL
jgi:hypothetical protein